ncbi:Uncharacterised protein [Mycobacterium tuberculosis]|nr:Uncharacterised protein [Mycobacterium tuberculosis]
MPTPSPHPVPSAASAYALHRPSVARPPCLVNSAYMNGVDITVTPPASARVHSSWRSEWQARCSATRDDEQAVSTDSAGPTNPYT